LEEYYQGETPSEYYSERIRDLIIIIRWTTFKITGLRGWSSEVLIKSNAI
jgi:hypothetical protein